jgi:hypothetical protein
MYPIKGVWHLYDCFATDMLHPIFSSTPPPKAVTLAEVVSSALLVLNSKPSQDRDFPLTATLRAWPTFLFTTDRDRIVTDLVPDKNETCYYLCGDRAYFRGKKERGMTCKTPPAACKFQTG